MVFGREVIRLRMPRGFINSGLLLAIATWVASAGCHPGGHAALDDSLDHYRSYVQQIDYPDVAVGRGAYPDGERLPSPPTVRNFDDVKYRDITLEEAVRLAIDNNDTVRQVGGVIVRAPTSAATVFDPAIIETDPRFGVESALSQFDAMATSSFNTIRRERQLNINSEQFRFRHENAGQFSAGLAKIGATGTQYSIDTTTAYLSSNWPFNRVPSVFESTVNASIRHPLMQGGGIEFNRIAGPTATPGNYRGVVLARINTDIALVDFQFSVRNLLRDVERGYWELYFAYRDLDAKIQGRRLALESWELEKGRVPQLRPPDQEAYAREQYYAAQVAVENAISGERGMGGVLAAERELRSLLGLSASDGMLLRPSTPPLTTDIQFDWNESLTHSQARREELRRQRWRVKQRELELVASRNFELPRLNAMGQYTFRGFGDDFIGQTDAAVNDLFKGDLQGWMLGLEYFSPVGRRLGHSAVRNAELLVRREKAVLLEQERQVALELRAAFIELDRAYVVTRSSYNRHIAAQIQLEAERKRNAQGETRLDLVLDAQRRSVLAEVAFHRAIVDYNQAVSQVNMVRGTLLDSLDVQLAEGPWSEESHDSARHEAARFVPRKKTPAVLPGPISLGEYSDRIEDHHPGAIENQPEPVPDPPATTPNP